MANKLTYFILLITIVMAVSSCDSEADFSGFIRSTDRVNDRFAQSMAWNDTHPVIEVVTTEDNYSLLVASDNHIGGTEKFEVLASTLEASEALGLVLVGDIVSGKLEDYDKYKELIAPVTKPIFSMIGNHDLYFDGWKTYYEYFGSSVYYFTVKTNTHSDLYICLDSGNATLGDGQLAWLEKLLSTQRQNYRYCTVFGHTNILRTRRTTSANPLIEEVTYLIDLFAKNNVDIVINGHDHVRDVEEFGNTTYIITDALKDDNPTSSYLILSADKNKIAYNFVEL